MVKFLFETITDSGNFYLFGAFVRDYVKNRHTIYFLDFEAIDIKYSHQQTDIIRQHFEFLQQDFEILKRNINNNKYRKCALLMKKYKTLYRNKS